ncbi:16S rRNA (guanine(527)-N(7))-methyltransferase RsmG [Mesomycoplasma flocculare]|uniref:Ribosomal RNA small subunit methyltransferase G n=2 Tax=Mesomycoplasma flocculare TaxID=2128 RepID=A0A0A8E7D3_MESFC|nr:16S rRNA (guanine(527)-N(7))-methyltransferase RsmG [Mesomycoplasma flocculare]MXR39184.1 16S rRNA (guanine(527)-N(7))-methyltransferase RsmG [Mycoplasma sp. MF12]AJC50115.1 16S rRNA methyltransferase GidB [Mesomycoplasma flocculare ATCC 27399]MXR06055.1 16S rRNA (guanine(527)-N(7))-methyltransferase RsmG [Mesomycoplasma flocculare]MXR12213.1 16S rRNA (guanine(527)-N(7))-methyltransferase RsmG [Mesomycoplasma flocculare]MXR13745.1 16S rRNA (guanine(527)-N(7))-methyltransferase RsmG [Mesomyc
MYKQKTKLFVSETQFAKLEKYAALIESNNKKFNLTAFSGNVLWKEGIFESILTMNFIISLSNKKKNSKLKILDIGAGVGFPSIPFLIANSNIELTISESMQKRCWFLKDISEKLDIRFNLICKPVQEISNKNFDIITARAVANLEKLDKITKKIQSPETFLAFIKGPKIFDETKKCRNCNYKIFELDNDLNKTIFVATKKINL